MPNLTIRVDIIKDGEHMPGFPIIRSSVVDEVTTEDSDIAASAPLAAPAAITPVTAASIAFIEARSANIGVLLNSDAANVAPGGGSFVLGQNGFVLVFKSSLTQLDRIAVSNPETSTGRHHIIVGGT